MRYWKCKDVRKRIDEIKSEIDKFEDICKMLPEGELLCCKNGKVLLPRTFLLAYLPDYGDKQDHYRYRQQCE